MNETGHATTNSRINQQRAKQGFLPMMTIDGYRIAIWLSCVVLFVCSVASTSEGNEMDLLSICSFVSTCTPMQVALFAASERERRGADPPSLTREDDVFSKSEE